MYSGNSQLKGFQLNKTAIIQHIYWHLHAEYLIHRDNWNHSAAHLSLFLFVFFSQALPWRNLSHSSNWLSNEPLLGPKCTTLCRRCQSLTPRVVHSGSEQTCIWDWTEIMAAWRWYIYLFFFVIEHWSMLRCISKALHTTRPLSILIHVSEFHKLSGESCVFVICFICILNSVIFVTVGVLCPAVKPRYWLR